MHGHDQYEKSVLEKASDSFLDIKKAANDLVRLYQTLGIPLNPQCSLSQLIKSSLAIARDWEAGVNIGDDRIDDFANVQTLSRILQITKNLREDEQAHIKEFRRGCILPFRRSPSKAKDKLWELELLTILRSHGINAQLDEPDIVLNLPSGNLGIACKRVYSGKNSENSMPYGLKQIKESKIHGILAVNIDDLAIPEEELLVAPNIELARKEIDRINQSFASRHERQLERYISEGRASAILISTWTPLYLENEGISACRQTLLWSHPELCDEGKRLIAEFESNFYK